MKYFLGIIFYVSSSLAMANDQRLIIKHSLGSTMLATLVTYCSLKNDSEYKAPYKACFDKGKKLIAKFNLGLMTDTVIKGCKEKAIKTCITPYLAELSVKQIKILDIGMIEKPATQESEKQ